MDYSTFIDLLLQLGKLGRPGTEKLEDAIREDPDVDGDVYLEEAFLQLADLAKNLGFTE